jgi:hypothetical protein
MINGPMHVFSGKSLVGSNAKGIEKAGHRLIFQAVNFTRNIISGSTIAALACCLPLILAGRVAAHQDPWGDIHPMVSVTDGKFSIVFNTLLPDQQPDYTQEKSVHRMIYNADGAVFAPRHSLGRKRSYQSSRPAELYGKSIALGRSTLIFDGDQSPKPAYILKSPEGKLTHVRLPWPEKTMLGLLEDVVATSAGIAITGKEPRPGSENYPLMFYWFAHGETGPPVILNIGETADIYHFPVASNIAFAAGRFWIGMMRPAGGQLKVALWSWKPGEKDGRFEFPDSPADWNSSLSLAAIGDQLCLAYHAVVPDGQRFPIARIVTVFHKAE